MPPYPFADANLLAQVAEDLVEKGWQPVWCPQRQNGSCTPSVNPSVTGYDAPYPTILPQPSGPHRLGFRVPAPLVMIDVDHYEGKHGAHTLDRAEEFLGPLPPTYKVTARGLDDPSGRFLFRKPVGLNFSDRALSQFANDNGKTDIEILHYGHRFSWAPGDINHKNGRTVQCFDPDGEVCLLPGVDDESIPELPQRWVDYLRNPPATYSLDSYTRPADGPQWWLQQPDESLATDDALKSFAFNMMMSRVPVEDIFPEWLRVSKADDPSWPWDREDFDRHTRGQAQHKAAQAIAREEEALDALPATRGELDRISQQTTEAFENRQLIAAAIEQQVPFDPALYSDMTRISGVVTGPADPDKALTTGQRIRGLEEYDRLLWNEVCRAQARKDAAIILNGVFAGYSDIADLPEPPEPETLHVTGKDTPGTRVIGRATITVISGQRSAGKTWAVATWAAQELRAGNKVIWLDFERQDMLLNAKLKALQIQKHLIKGQLQYAASLPPAARLVRDIQAASNYGQYRVLLVIDAFRTLQSLVVPGSTANDGDAVEQVYVEYLTPCVEAGANIALLDHLPKSGGSTFGSERKESAPDYVIRVEKALPFSKKTPGFSSLVMSKDRYGNTDEESPVGYLWMPGDGSAEGPSIREYPRTPELRNWAPETSLTLADTTGQSEKAQREAAILSIVRDNRLQLGPRPLGARVYEVYPDLFSGGKAATDLAGRMKLDGKLVKEDGKDGKYDAPEQATVMEVHSPVSQISPSVLEHPEAD
jgi:hypothetical protein